MRKSFGDTTALADCSLSADYGEIHAIVGENGSGKSTLAKIVGGVLPPDGGTVSVLGRPSRSPHDAQRRGIAFVMQEILVVEGARVLDNIFLGKDGLFRSTASASERLAQAAEHLGKLTDARVDLSQPIEALPLSVQQCVVITRALIGSPRVLIMDEATSALDSSSATRLYRELQVLAAAGVCVLIVTHRIEELRGFARRATVLRDGVSVGVLEREEITERALLELMSGERVAAEAGSARTRREGAVRLRLERAQIRPGSEPVDVEVKAGEVVGVAALEGHGAVELVEVAAGMRRPLSGVVERIEDAGTARIGSLAEATRHGIAYVSGDRKREGIFPNLSIVDNFGMGLYRTTRRGPFTSLGVVRELFRRYAERLSLRSHDQRALIGTLSGGNQQKVLIGRALAQRPRVLVFNDPTRGVDLRTKRDIYQLLDELAADGAGALLFSTELEELSTVCDRVVALRNGGVFAVLEGERLTSAALLSAMFGHHGGEDGQGQVER